MNKADLYSKVILVPVLKGTDTPFKNALIDSLKNKYEPKYQVKKIVLKNLTEIASHNYRLMIVMEQLKANLMMNGKIKTIKKNTDMNNVIYFLTTGDPKWKWQNVDIHHIASASEKPRLGTAWKELRTKVDAILK
ncbi:MAG: hypothetical protein FJ041_06080 [Candidatus Cloacimonetes bacterium]|nr:hypothetical protein [Candidatus Cloacimonadota bacterium]